MVSYVPLNHRGSRELQKWRESYRVSMLFLFVLSVHVPLYLTRYLLLVGYSQPSMNGRRYPPPTNARTGGL